MAFRAIRNMAFSIIVLLPLQLNVGSLEVHSTETNTEETIISQDETPPSASPNVVLLDIEGKYCGIEYFLKENENTIEFFSKTFAIENTLVLEDLKKINEDVDYDEYNIGRLVDSKGNLKVYSSFEEGLIEYFYSYSQKNPKNVSTTRIPYKGDADYIVDLIKYFTDIYDNVDYLTAVSIGAAESGYYKVTYMLNCNNVYGGMSNSGLIKYKNIEYGVLSYIRLLSKNYYGKGLTTLESIGRVYCPTYNENGQKVASSHWLNLVRTAQKKYQDSYTEVTVENLLNE